MSFKGKTKTGLSHTLLDVPVLLIEQTLQRLQTDQSFCEFKLAQVEKTESDKGAILSHDRSEFFAKLFRSINDTPAASSRLSEGKLPIAIGHRDIDWEPRSVATEPDVTFHVTGYGDFSIVPSEHFKVSELLYPIVQIPRRLVPFFTWLSNEKTWLVTTLAHFYYAIGKAQASFLLTLDEAELSELSVRKVIKAVTHDPEHTESTYSLLLQNRWVKIVSPGGGRVMPILYLLPTWADVAKYDRIHRERQRWQESWRDIDLAIRPQTVVSPATPQPGVFGQVQRDNDLLDAQSRPSNLPTSTTTRAAKSYPTFGQKSPDYPFGYGRCHCGCNKITQMKRTPTDSDWVWSSYCEGHEPKPPDAPLSSSRARPTTRPV